MIRCLIALLAIPALIAQVPAPAPLAQAGQTSPGQPPARPPALMSIAPETVVATIDGQKVTAAQLQVILRALSPAQQEAAVRTPQDFLRQFGLMRRLSQMAEKEGRDQKSPIREQLAYNRMLALAQAKLAASEEEVQVTPEEVKSFYVSNPDLFTSVRLKVIYISFSPNAGSAPQAGGGKRPLSEKEAEAKANKLYAELKAGAEFTGLVKAHSEDATSASKDGDFGTFRRSDRLPDEIKSVIFALKQGEVSKPVRQPNGFYLFRAEETGLEPLDKVRERVAEDLRAARFNEWVLATQNSVEVKIENEAAFAAAPPAAAK